MTFTSLSTDAQNILLTQFTFFFKFVLLFGFLAFSLFYIFYWKPNKQKETIFYSVGMVRLFLSTLTWIYIILFPLVLFLMSPQFSFQQIQDVFYPIYFIMITMIFIGLLVDFLYLLPAMVVKHMGLDIEDKKVKKFYAIVNRYFKKNG